MDLLTNNRIFKTKKLMEALTSLFQGIVLPKEGTSLLNRFHRLNSRSLGIAVRRQEEGLNWR